MLTLIDLDIHRLCCFTGYYSYGFNKQSTGVLTEMVRQSDTGKKFTYVKMK